MKGKMKETEVVSSVKMSAEQQEGTEAVTSEVAMSPCKRRSSANYSFITSS